MDSNSATGTGRRPSGRPPTAGARHQEYTLRNRRVAVPNGYLAVGMVAGVHGIRGEIKVELHTDFPDRFAPGTTLRLGETLEEIEITAARPHTAALLVKLRGVDTRSQADALRGAWFFIPEADAAELDEGTYWIHDIIGLAVEADDGRHLGRLCDVLVTGANDVYVVRTVPGVNRGQDLLLPAIAQVVQEVDLARRRMVVRVPDGLMDEDPEV